MGIMPRRDVVLTGIIAFAAGVAVGVNWKKLSKKMGPVMEKFGLQVADLGDFMSAAGGEDFASEFEAAMPKPAARRSRPKKETAAKARKNGRASFSTVRPAKKKSARRAPIVMPGPVETVANGTYGA